ncbi:hypothetical protein FEK35_08370 [Nocardia cyriacigeorgica]|uniref:Uncharacterized protein n=1 Tax=Nocardia cyriacigeorgica TaxID=135487 RepID=A0A5R8PHU6_9NOCA|nr:hypothetical protein [Nocardia cyriacigeorgica]TLG14398.1 hypothetical protein FEK35_08370 [Nocardia cyriacigeorgica]
MPDPHIVEAGPGGRRPAAIGLVREEVSGPHAVRYAAEIRRYAIRSGRSYVYTVRPPTADPDPVGYTLGIAATLGIDTIIVFDLAHTDNTPARICDHGYTLETICPATTWTPTNAPPSAEAVSRAAHDAGDTPYGPASYATRQSAVARGGHEAGDTPCGPVSCLPRRGIHRRDHGVRAVAMTDLSTLRRVLDGLTRHTASGVSRAG